MRFHFDEEQRLFQQSVREFLEGECSAEVVRGLWDSDSGRSAELWAKLAEMGLLGLLVPEEAGGLGRDESDFVLLLEETGRAALPAPIVETAAVAAPLLRELGAEATAAGDGATASIDDWIGRIATGELVATVGLQREPLVADAHVADLLLLESDGEIHAVGREAASIEAQPGIDPSRRLFRVTWQPQAATRIAAGAEAAILAEAAFDRAALGSAAQLLGVGQRMIDIAVAYACEREQFGQAIGAFQAVKHMLASAQVRVEFARPVVYRAAFAVARRGDDEEGSRAVYVSHAKAAAAEAALVAARAALQVHGAIGYTWECDLQIWMKRAWALEAAWGTSLWHRDRIARTLLDGSAPAPDFGFSELQP